MVTRVNGILECIAAWGKLWQVKFAAEKTQCMVISRLPIDTQMIRGRLSFNGVTLDITDRLNVLGVEFDNKL